MAKTKILPISLPQDLAVELDKAAKKESMTRSEFVRDMLRRRLAFTKLSEFQQEFSRRAKKAGIRNLNDAVKEVRKLRD